MEQGSIGYTVIYNRLGDPFQESSWFETQEEAEEFVKELPKNYEARVYKENDPKMPEPTTYEDYFL